MAILEDLLAPISDEKPGGKDVSYDDDYAQIGYLRELTDETPAANPDPDHEGVVELAHKILSEQSKDLTVALFLSEALLYTEGFKGFHAGLELVGELMTRFWDDMFPEEVEDRAFALDHLAVELLPRGQISTLMIGIETISLTEWGHHVHHYEEWNNAEADPKGAKGKGKKEEPDDSELSADNFGKALYETDKSFYKALKQGLQSCAAALGTIEELGKERFQGGHMPRYSTLHKAMTRVGIAVDTLLAKKLVDDPDPVSAQPVATGEPDGSDGGVSPQAAPQEGGGSARSSGGLSPEPTSADDAASRIAAAARFLRKENPTDPAPYQLVRGFRWGELRRAGGSLDVRLLEAPETSLRTRLKTLLLNEDWANLLEAGEEVMAGRCGRGWIDLQRYQVTALDNLGAAYQPVQAAIVGQLAALLTDVPELLKKTLMDDTPTANAETLEWLGLIGLIGDASTSATPAGAPDYDQDRLLSEATYERALEWVASGNARKGIELLKRRAEHENSERAKFITESLATSVMLEAGMEGVARPMLEDLVALIDERKLEEWESPDVVGRPLGLLYRCLPENDRNRQGLYDRICRIDPVLAIALVQNTNSGSSATSDQVTSEPTESSNSPEAVDSGSPDSE